MFSRFQTFSSAICRISADECLFVIVSGGLGPDVVGHTVAPLADPRHRLGERQGGALGLAEMRHVAPGGDGVEPRIGLLLLHRERGLDADAAAVDLAGAQIDEVDRRRRQAGLLHRLPQGRQRLQGFGQHQRRVLHSGLHHPSPSLHVSTASARPVTSARAPFVMAMTDPAAESVTDGRDEISGAAVRGQPRRICARSPTACWGR